MNQPNNAPQQPQQPKKPLTAAQRLEGLEMSFRLLDQEMGKVLNTQKISSQAISLMSKKLEALKRATGVTEEQIDYDPWAGAQLRHELFVLTAGMQTAERKYEYTAHESEGNMFTEIKEIAPESVTIETAKGTQTIAIG